MRRAIIVAGALAIAMLACHPAGSARPAAASGPLRLTVGTVGAFGSLDPRHGYGQVAKEIWNLQYPTLTSLDPKTLDPVPGLAASWSPAPGGKGWIYKLRAGLHWSDGQPVTADDVVYSINDARAHEWPYTNTTGTSFLRGLRARALDARSVEVTVTDVDGDLPGLLVHVVPEHVFAKVADLNRDVAALGVADGPWHVTATTPDAVQLDATAATNGPTLYRIVFRTYRNANSLIDALSRKQVDVVSGLPDSDTRRLALLPNVTIDHAPDGHQFILRFRAANETLRRAVSLAVDRTALVADAAHGVGTPGVVPIIAWGNTWALDASTTETLTSSLDAQPDRARQLLATVPETSRKITIGVSFGHPPARQLAELVQRALRAVGITATIADTDENDGVYSTAGVLLYDNVVTDNPYYPFNALDSISCDCRRAQHLPSRDFTTLISLTHERLQRLTEQARVVGLFEPDTLQAFRTDNVTGFLRDPEIRSLVVFGPTVSQYGQLTAAPPPPGEQLSNTAYAVGAVIVLVLCVAAFLFAAWIRRRFVISPVHHVEENHAG